MRTTSFKTVSDFVFTDDNMFELAIAGRIGWRCSNKEVPLGRSMPVRIVLWSSNEFGEAFPVPDEVPLITVTDMRIVAAVRTDDH